MQEWTFLKDVGVAIATLIIFGRIMYELVQASVEFYKGVREDNKERNQQFETLLRINETISHQMDLTRQSIEASTRMDERQDEAIRQTNTEMLAFQQDVAAGFEGVQRNLASQLQPVLALLDRILAKIDGLRGQLDKGITASEDELSDAVQALQGVLGPDTADSSNEVVQHLAVLLRKLVQLRQVGTSAVPQVLIEGAHPEQTTNATEHPAGER